MSFLTASPPKLVCLHCAGGTAGMYAAWPGLIGAAAQVVCLELPGRARSFQAPLRRRMDEVVAAVAPALDGLSDRAFALFGYSMGALVAYELARILEAQGGPRPLALFVAACRAPQLPPRRRQLHRLPDPALRRALESYAGTPPELLDDEELMQLVLPRLRADFEVCETYRWPGAAPLSASIAAFGGTGDRSVSAADLGAWRVQTRGDFVLKRLPGGHFFIQQQEPALALGVADLLRTLDRRAIAAAGHA